MTPVYLMVTTVIECFEEFFLEFAINRSDGTNPNSEKSKLDQSQSNPQKKIEEEDEKSIQNLSRVFIKKIGLPIHHERGYRRELAKMIK
jgi:hypothetical protein